MACEHTKKEEKKLRREKTYGQKQITFKVPKIFFAQFTIVSLSQNICRQHKHTCAIADTEKTKNSHTHMVMTKSFNDYNDQRTLCIANERTKKKYITENSCQDQGE